MRKHFVMVVLIFILLTISSCSAGQTTNQIEEKTETPTKVIPTPIPPTPTPTVNSYLIDESILVKNAVYFGNGSISDVYFSNEYRNFLVQTPLGVYLYDLDTKEKLGFMNFSYDVVAFDGIKGYMLIHFYNYGINSGDLITLTWNNSQLELGDPTDLLDWDGSNIILDDVVVSLKKNYFIGKEDFRDDLNRRVLSKRRNFGFWTQTDSLPTTFIKAAEYNIDKMLISPDDSMVAILAAEYSGELLMLAEISDEEMSTPQVIDKNGPMRDAMISFSPKSDMLVYGIINGQVMLYNIADQTKNYFDLERDNNSGGNNQSISSYIGFIDDNHIGIAIQDGSMVSLDITTGEQQTYSPSSDKIIKFQMMDDTTMLFATSRGVFEFSLVDNEVKNINSNFESYVSDTFIKDEKMVSISRLANNMVNLDLWDLSTFSKLESKTIEVAYPWAPEFYKLRNDDSVLLGPTSLSQYSESSPIIEIDTNTWEIKQANLENSEVNLGYGVRYSEAINQYIAVGSNLYELVFSDEDDPVFLTIDDRKKTLRKISDFDISENGEKVFIMEENGFIQIIDLVDPSLSKYIVGERFKDNVISLGDDKLFTYGFTHFYEDEVETAIVDISKGENEEFQIDYPGECFPVTFSVDDFFPDGRILINCGDGIYDYDAFSKRFVGKYLFSQNGIDGYFGWNYDLYPSEKLLLGTDSSGYFKIKKININTD